MDNRRILIIDDDSAIREDYKKILAPEKDTTFSKLDELEKELFKTTSQSKDDLPKFSLFFASQGRDGFEMAVNARNDGKPFAVAFIDIRMPPGWDGVETAAQIRKADPDIEIVMVTAYSDRDRNSIISAVTDASKLLYLKKPFDPDEIRQLAHSLTDKWNLRNREREYRNYLENLLKLFSSMRIEAESEADLLRGLLKMIAGFFDARDGVLAFRPERGANLDLLLSGKAIDGASDWLEHLPEDVMFPKDGLLLLPLRLAGGQGAILLELPKTGMESTNAQLLGRIVVSNIVNVFNVFHFQKEMIEKQSLTAVGNAVYRIIHDVNNPISAILGFAVLLENSRAINEKDLRRVRSILSAAENVRKLISSLHDLISDDIHLMPARTDVKSILIETSAEYQPKFEKASIEMILALPDAPMFIEIDPERFRRVIFELLDNALEATERSRGAKKVELGMSGTSDKISVWVKDTGTGIPDEHLDKIWQPFYTLARRNKLGLGLALVKKLVTLSNGQVSISTVLNEGTTVLIEFSI